MLADTAVRPAKPRENPYKLSDSGWLFLLVTPNCSRLWQVKHRNAGKEKLLALGADPEIPLEQARERRDEARRQLANGIDPGEIRCEKQDEPLTRKLDSPGKVLDLRKVQDKYMALRVESSSQTTKPMARIQPRHCGAHSLCEMPMLFSSQWPASRRDTGRRVISVASSRPAGSAAELFAKARKRGL
jgi:hypothetical protein